MSLVSEVMRLRIRRAILGGEDDAERKSRERETREWRLRQCGTPIMQIRLEYPQRNYLDDIYLETADVDLKDGIELRLWPEMEAGYIHLQIDDAIIHYFMRPVDHITGRSQVPSFKAKTDITVIFRGPQGEEAYPFNEVVQDEELWARMRDVALAAIANRAAPIAKREETARREREAARLKEEQEREEKKAYVRRHFVRVGRRGQVQKPRKCRDVEELALVHDSRLPGMQEVLDERRRAERRMIVVPKP